MPIVESCSMRIVAIGASAGGVPLLQRLVADLPGGLRASVLVVLHMHPTTPSRLPWLLGRRTALPVRAATDGEAIAPGTIYVAVPDLHMLTDDGRCTTSGPRSTGCSSPWPSPTGPPARRWC